MQWSKLKDWILFWKVNNRCENELHLIDGWRDCEYLLKVQWLLCVHNIIKWTDEIRLNSNILFNVAFQMFIFNHQVK